MTRNEPERTILHFVGETLTNLHFQGCRAGLIINSFAKKHPPFGTGRSVTTGATTGAIVEAAAKLAANAAACS